MSKIHKDFKNLIYDAWKGFIHTLPNDSKMWLDGSSIKISQDVLDIHFTISKVFGRMKFESFIQYGTWQDYKKAMEGKKDFNFRVVDESQYLPKPIPSEFGKSKMLIDFSYWMNGKTEIGKIYLDGFEGDLNE